jgi:hypothetical protein
LSFYASPSHLKDSCVNIRRAIGWQLLPCYNDVRMLIKLWGYHLITECVCSFRGVYFLGYTYYGYNSTIGPHISAQFAKAIEERAAFWIFQQNWIEMLPVNLFYQSIFQVISFYWRVEKVLIPLCLGIIYSFVGMFTIYSKILETSWLDFSYVDLYIWRLPPYMLWRGPRLPTWEFFCLCVYLEL